MPIFRVNKTTDYTIMSNQHLKEKDMSLKAKGLLCVMLSLPDNWDYSVDGLISMCKENETAILATLKELKQFGYLSISKERNNKGCFEYVYNIMECPDPENPVLDNPVLEKPELENQAQLNTNILNTKEIITNNKKNKEKTPPPKRKYGTYGRVLLTDDEYKRLVEEFGKLRIDLIIDMLDEYVESNNNKNKYSNFNLVIRKAIREEWFIDKKNTNFKLPYGFTENFVKETKQKQANEPEWLNEYVKHFDEGVEDL